jgi:hypothetical protein
VCRDKPKKKKKKDGDNEEEAEPPLRRRTIAMCENRPSVFVVRERNRKNGLVAMRVDRLE